MWVRSRYNYPTREAFRFHFNEPPSAPILHEENTRLKDHILTDRPLRDRRMDYQPMMSERAELDYRVAPDIIRKDAPFGTNDTPGITMKIIGGRHVPVIMKHPTYNEQYMGSRVQPLQPIADKPNHLDPRNYGDVPGGYYNKDVQPTAFVSRRPDSKDVSRTQYKQLPPIQQNRTRNDMSTVFEAEPWTSYNRPELAKETEYLQNYNRLQNGIDGDPSEMMYQQQQQQQSYQPPIQSRYMTLSNAEKDDLLKMLPPNSSVPPNDPIMLSEEQQRTLMKMVVNELVDFDPKMLQDLYLFCSKADRELRGFCTIEQLKNAFSKYGMFEGGLPHSFETVLTMIAAQFVDRNYPRMVNYEKLLSFIGFAIDSKSKGRLQDKTTPQHSSSSRFSSLDTPSQDAPRPQPTFLPLEWSRTPPPPAPIPVPFAVKSEKPKYYLDNGESINTGSIYRDREMAKLLRTVEAELSKSSYSMDWTRWWNAFYELDKGHRDTVSEKQIKGICREQNLPLSDSLINRILVNWCEGNNKNDGQYRWQSFLDFLSKVQPTNTGYTIPKRGYSPRRGAEPPYGRDPSPLRGDRGDRGDNRQDRDRERYSPDRDRKSRSPRYYKEPVQASPAPRHTYRSPDPYDVREYESRYYRNFEQRDVKDRSNRDGPSGYVPSWQHTSPRRSESPRRYNDQRTQRDDARAMDRDPYDRYMKQWVSNSDRERAYRPASKQQRPLSYAEPPRQENWYDGGMSPVREINTPVRRHRSLSPVRQASPAPAQQQPNTYRGPPKRTPSFFQSYDQRYNGDRDQYRQNSYRGENGQNTNRQGREEQIRELSSQIRDLETKFKKEQITQESMGASKDMSWVDRFLKMAQALYNSDVSHRGTLPQRVVMEIVRQYNDAFRLNLDIPWVEMAANAPEHLDRSNNVILRSFLANLSPKS